MLFDLNMKVGYFWHTHCMIGIYIGSIYTNKNNTEYEYKDNFFEVKTKKCDVSKSFLVAALLTIRPTGIETGSMVAMSIVIERYQSAEEM